MDIYSTITQRILSQLEAGVIPWRKTWSTGLPKSLTTGNEYRGINILMLATSPCTSRYWVTFREAHRLGGYVRKGQKAIPVVYWKWRTEDELQELEAKTGRRPAPCVPFTSAVFNLDQVEGIQRPDDDTPNISLDRLTMADSVFEVMPDKPKFRHNTCTEPVYNGRLDTITLPHLSQFESAEAYYATLFHELVHASGHEKRLNRFTSAEGTHFERYSFEELVAEFGAAFLCGFAGIQTPSGEQLQASYIDGWARVFRKDNCMLVRVASAAQRAADYIRGKSVLAGAPETGSNPETGLAPAPIPADARSNLCLIPESAC